MATVIYGDYGIRTYTKLVSHVLRYGQGRPSRNGDTLDAGHVITHLKRPYAALPLGVNRGVSRLVAAAEACQLIGAFSDSELMLKASPNFALYMEPGTKQFHGAYGVRIGHQLPAVIHKLKQDSHTRQAIITLWDPMLDNQPSKRDYPCTVALHFEVVAGELNMNVVMRSNDVWLGVPYDWFQFTQLQLTVSNILGVEPGTYTHQSFSTHLYTRDIDRAGRLFEKPDNDAFIEADTVRGFGTWGDYAIFKVMQSAKQVTRTDVPNPTISEQWYRRQFAPMPHPSQLAGDVAPRGEGPRAA